MQFQKLPKIAIIALTISIIFLTLTTVTATQIQANSSKRTVTTVNLGAYSDSACTHTITAINFLNINPGSTTAQTVYIKNTGNVPEKIVMTSNNWNPSNAKTYLTYSWNRQNTVLAAGATIQATLTLKAASNTGNLRSFSLDVTFTGTH